MSESEISNEVNSLTKLKIEEIIAEDSLSNFESDYKILERAEFESYQDKMNDLVLKEKRSDIELKKKIAWFLMGLLSVQSVIIFVLIFFQGFRFKWFYLDEYIFYILISGTLIESYFLVRIVVQHLFPNSVKRNDNK